MIHFRKVLQINDVFICRSNYIQRIPFPLQALEDILAEVVYIPGRIRYDRQRFSAILLFRPDNWIIVMLKNTSREWVSFGLFGKAVIDLLSYIADLLFLVFRVDQQYVLFIDYDEVI